MCCVDDGRVRGMETYLEDLRHLALLWKGAVILDGQDDGHVSIDKRGPVNCLHHILEHHGRELVLEAAL